MESYQKLRPWTDIERCECSEVTGLYLVYMLTDNPIHCFSCRKEVDPERLKLTDREVDDVASAMRVYGALYNLWLDSGEYEAWAKQQLVNPAGQVNRKGMEAAKALSLRLPTYYWWFSDYDDEVPENCPSCGDWLDTAVKFGAGKCDACCVAV